MTTIVAVEKGGSVAVAWDSMSSVGSQRVVNQTGPPKVLRYESSLIGIAGFAVYYNLLEHYLDSAESPRLQDEKSIFAFFIQFWRALHDEYHMIDDQFDTDTRAPFADLGTEFVVANRHGIFHIKEILSVSRVRQFCALGSGASHAEGALMALYEQKRSARTIATETVEIAIAYDTGSGGPVECLEITD